MVLNNQEIINERERFKKIVNEEVCLEFNLERNNPQNPKGKLREKINYLKDRIEHLSNRILYKIDNPNHKKRVE